MTEPRDHEGIPMNLSDSTARDLLAAAERGDDDGLKLARSTNRASSLYSISIGVLVAAFQLATVYIFPSANLVWIFGSVAVYALAILAAVFVYSRVRTGAPAGWNRRYAIGFSVTMALYLGGVVLATAAGWTSSLFWVMYAILVALPVSVAGSMRTKR